jgi:hypothetical protein
MAAKDNGSRKIGEGHAAAMLRLGGKEIRNVAYPGSNIAQPTEYGIFGTLTPGEIAEARRSEERDLEEEPKSILGEWLKRAERTNDDRGRENREPEMER